MGRECNIKIWLCWWVPLWWPRQLRDFWIDGQHFNVVWGGAPAQACDKLHRIQKDKPNVEIWTLEDANFLTKLASQAKPGFMGIWVQGLPDDNQWFLGVLYPVGGPKRTREYRNNIDESTLLTSVKGHFTWKSPKLVIFEQWLRGLHWTHSSLPSSWGPHHEPGAVLHYL